MALGMDLTGPITAVQQAAVEALLRQRDLAPRRRERLEMVKAVALGHDLPTIARWSGRTERTVRRWLSRFATGGWRPSPMRPEPAARPKPMRPTAARPRQPFGRRRAR